MVVSARRIVLHLPASFPSRFPESGDGTRRFHGIAQQPHTETFPLLRERQMGKASPKTFCAPLSEMFFLFFLIRVRAVAASLQEDPFHVQISFALDDIGRGRAESGFAGCHP
jgi:hypothetical protein